MTKKEFREIEKKLYSKKNIEKGIISKLDKIKAYEDGAKLDLKTPDIAEKVQGTSIFKSELDIRFELINNLRMKILEEQKKIDIIDSALDTIKDNKFYNIIELRYFENKLMKEISYILNLDNTTVIRQRNMMFEKIKDTLI